MSETLKKRNGSKRYLDSHSLLSFLLFFLKNILIEGHSCWEGWRGQGKQLSQKSECWILRVIEHSIWWLNIQMYVIRAKTSCLRLNQESGTHSLMKYDSYIAMLINKRSSWKKHYKYIICQFWDKIPLVSRFSN